MPNILLRNAKENDISGSVYLTRTICQGDNSSSSYEILYLLVKLIPEF